MSRNVHKFSTETNALVTKVKRYFSDWDDFAAVRNKEHTYKLDFGQLEKQLNQKTWFIPEGVAILAHSELAHLDKEQKQYLIGRFLLQFLEYGTLMEHEYVNTITADLAFGECNYALPESMRLDALKIYTDEGYHAFFTLEAAQYIREYIGLPKDGAWPLKNSRLEGLRTLIDKVPLEDKFLVKFGITTISETVAAKELVKNMRQVVIQPIVNLFADHAQDEMKHCLYFSVLLEVVWEQLTHGERSRLANYFPLILKRFVDINVYPLQEALLELGIHEDKAKKIINESYPTDFCVKRAIDVASVTFRVFKKMNVFDYPGVKEAFMREGFPIEVFL